LKLILCGSSVQPPESFRARAGAAPLKHDGLQNGDPIKKIIPRPRGRGPVEAQSASARTASSPPIPRPRGRGPVEAPPPSVSAPRKRIIPRPRGRGPVEASPATTVLNILDNHSAPARARPR